MPQNSRIHALISTARIANIPSVAVNVWLGVVMAMILNPPDHHPGLAHVIQWSRVLVLMGSGICLYVAGNFLNDWMDRDWDAQRRPERALPRGLFKPGTYLCSAVVFSAAGLVMAALAGWPAAMVAAAILVFIVIYTVWHKRSVRAVIAMGLCRAGLVWLGMSGVAEIFRDFSPMGTCAGLGSLAISSYIIGLSLSARLESITPMGNVKHQLPQCLLVLTAVLMVSPRVLIGGSHGLWLLGLVPYAVWMVLCEVSRMRGNKNRISLLLAGIPLVDWIFLLPAAVVLRQDSLPFPHLDMGALLIPPAAFVMALLLQRIAPAT